MAKHDLDKLLPVRDRLVVGRKAQGAGGRGHLAEEALHTSGAEEEEQPGVVRVDMERVPYAFGRVDERARDTFLHLVAVLEPHSPERTTKSSSSCMWE